MCSCPNGPLYQKGQFLSPLDRKVYHYLICEDCEEIYARDTFFKARQAWKDTKEQGQYLEILLTDAIIPMPLA